MRRFTLLSILFFIFKSANSQCTVTTISGDYTVASSIILSGTYSVTGKFVIPQGVTVFVNKYATNSCGKLEIYAKSAIINGVINADDAGYTGGLGGVAGTSVTSITGDAVALTACNNKDNTGQVTVEAGKGGSAGSGPGAGLGGANGVSGSGPKQQCLNNNDEAGMIGSGGGGGGGAGASYGGVGSSGGNGGNGTSSYTATGANVSTGFAVVQGTGGLGGTAAAIYGTSGGTEIDLGSGGAGAGGGARSFALGLNGNKGGNGGGMVKIVVQDTLILNGTISANGSNGLNGGNGGDGGVTAKCCTDGCDDCGEATLACGAGGGSGSGAGSGGGILLQSTNYLNIVGTLNAKGGNGGNGGNKGNGVSCNYSATFCGTQALISGNGQLGNLGGAGGGGRIKIFATSCQTNTINPVTSVLGGTSAVNAASGTYSVICNLNVSLSEYTKYHELTVYPNPAKDKLVVKFKFPQYLKASDAKIYVFDINGKQSHVQDCILNTNEEETISLESLSKGVYFIKLISSEVTVVQKFIKE